MLGADVKMNLAAAEIIQRRIDENSPAKYNAVVLGVYHTSIVSWHLAFLFVQRIDDAKHHTAVAEIQCPEC